MTNTQTAENLLMTAISSPGVNAKGEPGYDYDKEFLLFQMFDIKTDNFPAFVESYKSVKTIANHLRFSTIPTVGNTIANLMEDIARNHMISLAGCSSQNGKFLKSLMEDKTESKILYQGDQDIDKSTARKMFEGIGSSQRSQQEMYGTSVAPPARPQR